MFDGAKLKVEWAKKHIINLKGALDAFIKTHPHSLSISNDPQNGSLSVQVRLREKISTDFPLMIGDAVHNLRAALDHATWELVGIDRGTQDRWLQFPGGKDKTGFEATCNGIKTPRSDTKKFFIAFAAYPTGAGEKIWGLNELDNSDKHTILTPVIGVARLATMRIMYPDGRVMVTMQRTRASMGGDGIARFAGVGPGLSIEFDHDADPTFDVFLGNVQPFRFNPIIETLENLGDAVSNIVGEFERFVATRPSVP